MLLSSIIPEITLPGFMAGNEWLLISILAVMVATLLNAIILMFAHAFSAHEIERGAKAEIMQSAATAFMIIFIIFMLNSAQSFAIYQFFGSEDSTVDCGGEKIRLSQIQAEVNGGLNIGAMAVVKCRILEQATQVADLQKKVYEGLEGDVSGNTPFNVFGALSIYSSLLAIPIFQGTYVEAWYSAAESYRLLNYLTILS